MTRRHLVSHLFTVVAVLGICTSAFKISVQAARVSDSDVSSEFSQAQDGRTLLRFQQVHQGFPVIGGGLIVQSDRERDVRSVLRCRPDYPF